MDADALLVLAIPLELYDTFGSGEQSVVAAKADILTGFELSAALADQNIAAFDQLAIEAFDTQHFGFAITTVA